MGSFTFPGNYKEITGFTLAIGDSLGNFAAQTATSYTLGVKTSEPGTAIGQVVIVADATGVLATNVEY